MWDGVGWEGVRYDMRRIHTTPTGLVFVRPAWEHSREPGRDGKGWKHIIHPFVLGVGGWGVGGFSKGGLTVHHSELEDIGYQR